MEVRIAVCATTPVWLSGPVVLLRGQDSEPVSREGRSREIVGAGFINNRFVAPRATLAGLADTSDQPRGGEKAGLSLYDSSRVFERIHEQWRFNAGNRV